MKSTDDQGLIPVIVASEADSTYIRTIPTAQPAAGDGSVSLELGLPPECATAVAAGGKRPQEKDMNGIWNLFSRAIQSLQAYRGVYSASFATAIGGYPKYAMVSDSSGNFWVSTADANTTVPGATGANWKSLFNGYATEAWANGLFATIAQLNAETTRATTIESNLQSSKYDKTGGVLTGQVTVQTGRATNTSGQYNYTLPLRASNTGGVYADLLGQELVGTSSQLVLRLGYNGTDKQYWWFGEDGTISGSQKGDVAWQSDLAAYQPAGSYVTTDTYAADFSTSDSRVINLAYGHRIQAFTITVDGNGTNSHRITYPVAFSGASSVAFVGNDTSQSRSVSLSNNTTPDSTGFNISVSVHGNSTAGSTDGLTLSVIAVGPK